MAGLKPRARTLVELAENARFYVAPVPIPMEPKAAALLDADGRPALAGLAPGLRALKSFEEGSIEDAVRRYADEHSLTLGKVAQPSRAPVTDTTTSPGTSNALAAHGPHPPPPPTP